MPTPLANALAQYAPPKQQPSTPLANALMEYAARVKGDFQHGLDESAQGFGEMVNGQLATGIPRTFLGGLGWMGSPVSGAVSPLLNPVLQPVAQGVHDYVGKPVENATGYPADLTTELALALALPKALHGAGKVVNHSVPYLSSLGDAVGLKPTPANQLNMFIGGNAKTFPSHMVPRAEKLEAEGIPATDIRDMTGLHRGADGKWRYEIPDAESQLLQPLDDPRSLNVNTALKHDELLKAYPELGYIDLQYSGPEMGGKFIDSSISDTGRSTIVAGGKDAAEQHRVLLHELMHAIQKKEGFTPGTSSNQSNWAKYFNNAGEVEARNVEARMNMTKEELAQDYNHPVFTQDVPTAKQIVPGQHSPELRAIIDEARANGPYVDAYIMNKLQDMRTRAMNANDRDGYYKAQDLMEEYSNNRVSNSTKSPISSPVGGGSGKVEPVKPAASQSVDEYAMSHRPPMSDSGAPLHDVTGGGNFYPDDVYSHKAVQYYGTGSGAMDHQTISLVHQMRNKPNATVTIYRAVPHTETKAEQIFKLEQDMKKYMARGVVPAGAKQTGSDWYNGAWNDLQALKNMPDTVPENVQINRGDWVTINRAYAKDHGESSLRGGYKIISKKVKAKDIYTNGDSIHEWGYDPKD